MNPPKKKMLYLVLKPNYVLCSISWLSIPM